MFCPNCGIQLPEDARFCGSCGTRITALPAGGGAKQIVSPAAPVEGRSPAQPGETAAASSRAKAKSKDTVEKPAKRPKAAKTVKNAAAEEPAAAVKGAAAAAKAKAAETLVSVEEDVLSFPAPSEGGEAALGTLGPSLPQASAPIPGPLKALGGGLKNLFADLAAAVKEPKRLIPALVLAVIWLVLDILKAAGVESQATRVLSFLSFANGGMEGGVSGLVGGLIGKGLTAGALTSLVALFGKKEETGKRGLGNTLKGGFGFTKETLGAYLTGIGAALLLYLFFSGGALKMTFMAGIASSFLAARAALHEGFLKKLLSSFTSRGKTAVGPGPAGLIRGLALGFAAAALLALPQNPQLFLIPGGALLLGGAVLMILRAAKKGGAQVQAE